MVKVKLGGLSAAIDHGVWRSESRELAVLLQIRSSALEQPLYVPNLDLWIASAVMRQVGGAVVDAPDPERVDATCAQ